ncbi:AMP-binding protein [Acinetobacter sp. WZC-1]|uniref:AMP-binding protein n=1 Tax=Acinetobacter sp. WZC-1 TaxID=3459034 RepID=UPI00403DCE04
MLCHFQHHLQSTQTLCIREDLTTIRFLDFWQDVTAQMAAIQRLADGIQLSSTQAGETIQSGKGFSGETQPGQTGPGQIWALWQPDSYDFLVLLLAAVLAKKQIMIVPNRVRELERQLAAQGIYFLSRQPAVMEHAAQSLQLDDAVLNQARIYFYTSGSTGQPKKIPRTFRQLLNEIQGLEQYFQLQPAAVAVATVSHQHIYGLLFKLLWPLACGRSFYNPQLVFPEDVVQAQRQLKQIQLLNYVISSPALLKRWTQDVSLQDCLMVYCSGGQLDSGVRPLLNRPITEVLGSSETGGIAYRQQDEALWLPFADVEVQVGPQQELTVRSSHAFSEEWICTGDRAEMQEAHVQSPFRLLGRLDRIVKLEEKRLSLDVIEQEIQSLPEVQQCHVLILQHANRQLLACVAVLTDAAQQLLIQQGKPALLAALKVQLTAKLEGIATPRQWRFLSQLPQNTQSKLNKNDIQALFQSLLLPVVLKQQQDSEQTVLELEFPAEMACFKGHFPGYPIYPGVGQVGFIQHFARECWSELAWCSGYEQLKFQELIRPYTVVQLKLQRKQHKVHFEMYAADKRLASGRLLFALKDQGEDA